MISGAKVAPGRESLDVLRSPGEETGAKAIRDRTGRHCGI